MRGGKACTLCQGEKGVCVMETVEDEGMSAGTHTARGGGGWHERARMAASVGGKDLLTAGS